MYLSMIFLKKVEETASGAVCSVSIFSLGVAAWASGGKNVNLFGRGSEALDETPFRMLCVALSVNDLRIE